MNIVWSSDENYVQHLAVSMLSLLDTNQATEKINCYIISNNISEASRRELEKLAAGYGRRISWIDFEPFKERLELNMAWPISISSYARLFLQEMLPESVTRVLYLDCDTVVCDSLEELFALDLNGCSIGGVRDFVAQSLKEAIGLSADATYINAGILLIDLEAWRREHILDCFLDYIQEQNGRVIHHDQGVINHCLHDRTYVLPPRYNAMTPLYMLNYQGLRTIWGSYYTDSVCNEAKENPAILHFTPGFTTQVWDVKCKHPLKERYYRYLNRTVWKDRVMDKPISAKIRVMNWIALHMPKVYTLLIY